MVVQGSSCFWGPLFSCCYMLHCFQEEESYPWGFHIICYFMCLNERHPCSVILKKNCILSPQVVERNVSSPCLGEDSLFFWGKNLLHLAIDSLGCTKNWTVLPSTARCILDTCTFHSLERAHSALFVSSCGVRMFDYCCLNRLKGVTTQNAAQYEVSKLIKWSSTIVEITQRHFKTSWKLDW